MKFLLGILVAVFLFAVAAAAVVLSGSYNTAAVKPPGALETKVAGLALDRSVAHRAPKTANPIKASPEVVRQMLGEYKEMCVVCHGAPGVEATEIAQGLNPAAPDLTLPKVQRRSDAELFWIMQNGIRMTGMPAFGPTHKDEELWSMVVFVRHLPELKPEEEKLLKTEEPEGHEHGAEAPAPHAH